MQIIVEWIDNLMLFFIKAQNILVSAWDAKLLYYNVS